MKTKEPIQKLIILLQLFYLYLFFFLRSEAFSIHQNPDKNKLEIKKRDLYTPFWWLTNLIVPISNVVTQIQSRKEVVGDECWTHLSAITKLRSNVEQNNNQLL